MGFTRPEEKQGWLCAGTVTLDGSGDGAITIEKGDYRDKFVLIGLNPVGEPTIQPYMETATYADRVTTIPIVGDADAVIHYFMFVSPKDIQAGSSVNNLNKDDF